MRESMAAGFLVLVAVTIIFAAIVGSFYRSKDAIEASCYKIVDKNEKCEEIINSLFEE